MKFLSSVIFLFSLGLYSYPIVAESEAIELGQILTLYPDHTNKNKVYFFPNSSTISEDDSGMPTFGLTTWGLLDTPIDYNNAGAWMTFTARLVSDRRQRRALNTYLNKNPHMRVAVIPVKDSTLGLKSTSGKPVPFARLIEQMSISDIGGHAEDEIGFMGTLTGVGAKVFKDAVKKPDSFKINYCYTFDGAGPDMDARITVKWNKVYDHFKSVFKFKYYYVKGKIAREFETLRQKNYVKWEITGGTADDMFYVKQVTNEIIKRMFKSELQYRPTSSGSYMKGWSLAKFSLDSTFRSEHKTETWEISRRELVERERCLPINIRNVNKYYEFLVSDT